MKYPLALLLAFFALIGTTLWWVQSQHPSIIISFVEILANFSSRWYGPLIFLFILTVRPLTFLPISIFTITSGLLFGFTWGALISYTGILLSACLAYLSAQYVERYLLKTKLKDREINLLGKYPFESLLFLHLTMLPFDLINYSAGVRQIAFRNFLPAVALGMVPGNISLTLIGASINLNSLQAGDFTQINIDWQYMLLAVLIFLTTVTVSYFYRYYKLSI